MAHSDRQQTKIMDWRGQEQCDNQWQGTKQGAIKGKGKGKEAQEHRSRQNPTTYKGHKPNKGKGKGKPSQTWQPRPQDWEGNSKVVNNMEQYLQQEPKQAMLYKPTSAEDLEELFTEYEANNQDLPVTIIIDKYDLDMDDNPFHNKTWEDRRIPATIDGIVVTHGTDHTTREHSTKI